jgi:ArsR family transcriptional regulator, arsenate/arsenite/antimonite-responsive transcriptional repressor
MSIATINPDAPAVAPQLPVLNSCCAPTSAVGDDDAASLARMFKALADPARVKILSMLLNADEVCACDMADGIGKTAATTSHHLKLLKEAGLITGERRGTWVHYRVVPQRLAAIRDALTDGPS